MANGDIKGKGKATPNPGNGDFLALDMGSSNGTAADGSGFVQMQMMEQQVQFSILPLTCSINL